MLPLNWSNFKPEFSGKPDEDAEAHLLCSNDWMNVHHFVEGAKVQRFCLTLLGEARLWYHALEPINIDWQGLQDIFRQQYCCAVPVLDFGIFSTLLVYMFDT